MSKERIVVIGNGMVGHKFLESFSQKPNRGNFEITTFCEEPRYAYDRVQLSAYFSGKTAEDLSLVEPGFYENNDINVLLNSKAESIDRDAKKSSPAVVMSWNMTNWY